MGELTRHFEATPHNPLEGWTTCASMVVGEGINFFKEKKKKVVAQHSHIKDIHMGLEGDDVYKSTHNHSIGGTPPIFFRENVATM